MQLLRDFKLPLKCRSTDVWSALDWDRHGDVLSMQLHIRSVFHSQTSFTCIVLNYLLLKSR